MTCETHAPCNILSLCCSVSVRRIREPLRSPGRTPSNTVRLSAPPRRRGADLPKHDPSPCPQEANCTDEARLSRASPAVYMLRQAQELDRLGLVGLRGPNIPRNIFSKGNGNAY